MKIIKKEELDYLINNLGYESILHSEEKFAIENERELMSKFIALTLAINKFESETGYKIKF